MLGEVLKVGDEVIINIPDSNWQWGYHPVPEQRGTRATVTGFGEIDYSRVQNYGHEPGVYVNHSWVTLEGIDGSISCCFLDLPDEADYEARLVHYREHRDEAKIKLRDLPETEYWEGDIVELRPDDDCPWDGVTQLQVVSINYRYIGQTCNDGVTPMPLYNVEPVGGGRGTTAMRGSGWKLVSRGNVWKHYHGEPLTFASLEEEANFAQMLGQTDEVRNEVSGNYAWTMADLIPAVKAGKVDVLKMSNGLFGGRPSRHAIRFRDRDLGERIRAKFLEEFGDADVEKLDAMAEA